MLAALAAGLVAAAPASPAEQLRVAGYCSPSGDVCYAITNDSGTINFRLTLAAKYFSRYGICVKPLGQAVTCKTFRVRKTAGSTWGRKIAWQRNFPTAGPKRYRVTWARGGRRMGPALYFTLPAPV